MGSVLPGFASRKFTSSQPNSKPASRLSRMGLIDVRMLSFGARQRANKSAFSGTSSMPHAGASNMTFLSVPSASSRLGCGVSRMSAKGSGAINLTSFAPASERVIAPSLSICISPQLGGNIRSQDTCDPSPSTSSAPLYIRAIQASTRSFDQTSYTKWMVLMENSDCSDVFAE